VTVDRSRLDRPARAASRPGFPGRGVIVLTLAPHELNHEPEESAPYSNPAVMYAAAAGDRGTPARRPRHRREVLIPSSNGRGPLVRIKGVFGTR